MAFSSVEALLSSGKLRWSQSAVLDSAALDSAALDSAALDSAALDSAALDSAALDSAVLPEWSLPQLSGRLIELIGDIAGAAALTAIAILVRDAQQRQEPVIWIGRSASSFHPADLMSHGIDLGALAVVRVATALESLRAADVVLRSGAFGLVVLDFESSDRTDLPLAAQVRLQGLVKHHEAACVVMRSGQRGKARAKSGCGSTATLASLRVVATRRRRDGESGDFECVLHAVKDKRGGREWTRVRACRGPLGLR